jgi:hypothetical protein
VPILITEETIIDYDIHGQEGPPLILLGAFQTGHSTVHAAPF